MNKASGGDGIPVELFLISLLFFVTLYSDGYTFPFLLCLHILKDDAVKVPHSICQQNWKTQQWPQDWKRSVFIPIPKKGNAKECSNYRTIDSFHMLGKDAPNSPS